MRILVGWDNAQQAELISMYLGIGDHETVMAIGPDQLSARLNNGEAWDVVFLSVTLPDVDGGFQTFSQIKTQYPDIPIVGACFPADVYRVVRFMAHGMTAYAIRDEQGDYLFMLMAVLESAVEAVWALRNQKLAEKLREEVQSVRKLQESMIPAQIVAPAGCTIVARYEPSQIRVAGGRAVTMAGGDYYDVFNFDDNQVVMLVGDASGSWHEGGHVHRSDTHACSNDSGLSTYGHSEIRRRKSITNTCQHSVVTEDGGFITLCYGLLRLDTNELQWTSAGHPIPLVQDMTTGQIARSKPTAAAGLPLAIYPDMEYDAFTYKTAGKISLVVL